MLAAAARSVQRPPQKPLGTPAAVRPQPTPLHRRSTDSPTTTPPSQRLRLMAKGRHRKRQRTPTSIAAPAISISTAHPTRTSRRSSSPRTSRPVNASGSRRHVWTAPRGQGSLSVGDPGTSRERSPAPLRARWNDGGEEPGGRIHRASGAISSASKGRRHVLSGFQAFAVGSHHFVGALDFQPRLSATIPLGEPVAVIRPQLAGRRYRPPLVISTKTMRATLLASATAVSLNFYLTVSRSSIPLAHRRRASLWPLRWRSVAQAPTTRGQQNPACTLETGRRREAQRSLGSEVFFSLRERGLLHCDATAKPVDGSVRLRDEKLCHWSTIGQTGR